MLQLIVLWMPPAAKEPFCKKVLWNPQKFNWKKIAMVKQVVSCCAELLKQEKIMRQ